MGIYALERVGIGHDSKEEVRKECPKFTTEDYFGEKNTAFQYEPSHTAPTMELSYYTSALTYGYYANKIGIDIPGISLTSMLKLLPLYRPYRITPPGSAFDFDFFASQLTMIFNLVHVLSNNGEFQLNRELLPQEFGFLSNEHVFRKCLDKKDIHLVGEVVHCLHVFGCDQANSPLVRDGSAYILAKQKLDGSWPTRDGLVDSYTRYHAVMCAVNALNKQHFRGYGPAEPKLLALLSKMKDFTRSHHDFGSDGQGGGGGGGDGVSLYHGASPPPLRDLQYLDRYYATTAGPVQAECGPSAQAFGVARLNELLAVKREEQRTSIKRYGVKTEGKVASKRQKRAKASDS